MKYKYLLLSVIFSGLGIASEKESNVLDLDTVTGYYKSYTTEATLSIHNREKGTLKILTSVRIDECSGKIEALGEIEDNHLIVYTEGPKDWGRCQLTISFLPGKKIKIVEDNCMNHHGLNCGWLGQVLVKKDG